MNQLPTGTVTFLFTDIEASTKLWQMHHDTMPAALRRHHTLLSEAITGHNGYVFQIVGDAFCAAFSTANDGLDAALEAQRLLAVEKWGKPALFACGWHYTPAMQMYRSANIHQVNMFQD